LADSLAAAEADLLILTRLGIDTELAFLEDLPSAAIDPHVTAPAVGSMFALVAVQTAERRTGAPPPRVHARFSHRHVATSSRS
jgi:hypothetical protein